MLEQLRDVDSIIATRSGDVFYQVTLHAPLPHSVHETHRLIHLYPFSMTDQTSKKAVLDLSYRYRNLHTTFVESYKLWRSLPEIEYLDFLLFMVEPIAGSATIVLEK